MMVVEQKMTQPVDESTKLSESNKEPIEELDNLFNSIGWRVQNHFLSYKTFVRFIEIEPHPVKYQSRSSWSPMVTYHALNANN